MASGDIVGVSLGPPLQPAANFATFDIRAGGSTPAEGVPVYDFDDTTDEFLDFLCRLSGYGGNGLTITFDASATDTTVDPDVMLFQAAIRRIANDAEDIDASHTYDFNSAAETQEPSASGETVRITITFTNGADMDNLADGETFIVRFKREVTTSGANLNGDAELWIGTLLIKET